MKKVIFLIITILMVTSVAIYAQSEPKKEKKRTLVCKVVYRETEKSPDKKLLGGGLDTETNQKYYLYAAEDIIVKLILDGKVIKKTSTDFEGKAYFKKLKPGEYVVKVDQQGLSEYETHVSLVESISGMATLLVYKIE